MAAASIIHVCVSIVSICTSIFETTASSTTPAFVLDLKLYGLIREGLPFSIRQAGKTLLALSGEVPRDPRLHQSEIADNENYYRNNTYYVENIVHVSSSFLFAITVEPVAP